MVGFVDYTSAHFEGLVTIGGRMKKQIAAMIILILAILLTGCYESARSAKRGGYQFDEPKEYCRYIETDSGFRMYCPEGRIEIEFVNSTIDETADDVLAVELSKIPEAVQYSVSKLESKHSGIVLAEMISDGAVGEGNYPTYIAVSLFGSDRMVVVRGFLYEVEFEDQFKPAFRIVAMTLEPYEP